MNRGEIQEILNCPVCGNKMRIDRVDRSYNEKIDTDISSWGNCIVKEETTFKEGYVYYECSECNSTLKVPLTYKTVARKRFV